MSRVIRASLPGVSDRHPCRSSGERLPGPVKRGGYAQMGMPRQGHDSHSPGASEARPRGRECKSTRAPRQGARSTTGICPGWPAGFPEGPRGLSVHPGERWKTDDSVRHGLMRGPPIPTVGLDVAKSELGLFRVRSSSGWTAAAEAGATKTKPRRHAWATGRRYVPSRQTNFCAYLAFSLRSRKTSCNDLDHRGGLAFRARRRP